jgi:hypothetical protein
LGVFYTHFSVCNVSIDRYKIREMQLWTALGYLCINHEIIGICLVLCPFVMKFPKFMVYSGDCRAPNDVVQVNLKHMLYHSVEKVCAPCGQSFWILNVSVAFWLHEIPHLIPKLLCVRVDWLSCRFIVHSVIKIFLLPQTQLPDVLARGSLLPQSSLHWFHIESRGGLSLHWEYGSLWCAKLWVLSLQKV